MLSGIGYYIWQAINCEGGDLDAIVDLAVRSKLSHILLKIADGVGQYNISVDRVALVQKLQAKGIQVWGWQYVYGYDPQGEADRAINEISLLKVNGFVVDAEAEYKLPGRANAANIYMLYLRSGVGSTFPIALSSYRYPSYHMEFPWQTFLGMVDLSMPQVYWMESHNAGDQLQRSFNEYKSLAPKLPYLPTGAAFGQGSWEVTVDDIKDFTSRLITLGLSGANYWSWDYARSHPSMQPVWDATVGGVLPGPDPVPPPSEEFGRLAALRDVRVRSGPGTGYSIKDMLHLGDGRNDTKPLYKLDEVIRTYDDDWVCVGWDEWVAFRYQGIQYLTDL